jgi:hypothetical protein
MKETRIKLLVKRTSVEQVTDICLDSGSHNIDFSPTSGQGVVCHASFHVETLNQMERLLAAVELLRKFTDREIVLV